MEEPRIDGNTFCTYLRVALELRYAATKIAAVVAIAAGSPATITSALSGP